MSHTLLIRLSSTDHSVVVERLGAEARQPRPRNGAAGYGKLIACRRLFILIAHYCRPTAWHTVERDDRGFLLTGPDLLHGGKSPKGWPLERDPYLLETNVPGIFAVGDVRHGSVKRVASGVGEGSVAVQFVHQYLSKV
jgi:thioredoxin reductase (NADPH)